VQVFDSLLQKTSNARFGMVLNNSKDKQGKEQYI
jgi:hypothetical protein